MWWRPICMRFCGIKPPTGLCLGDLRGRPGNFLCFGPAMDRGYCYKVRNLWGWGHKDHVKPLTSEPVVWTAASCWCRDPLWSTLIRICEDSFVLMLCLSCFWEFYVQTPVFITCMFGWNILSPTHCRAMEWAMGPNWAPGLPQFKCL